MTRRVPIVISMLAAGVMALAPLSASAADPDGRFAPRGIGPVTCTQFLQALDERQENVFFAAGWLEGYLTAINQFLDDTFDIAPWQDTDTILNLVRNNCERNPDQRMFAIVNSMVEFLSDQRLTRASDRTMVEHGEQRTLIYRAVLRDVQQELINKGLLDGSADGQFGAKTRAAIEQFQQEQNIAVTGIPDQMTLWLLLGGGTPPQPQGG
ncbi:MAG: peptidoglycan-binding protein [Rhodospirillales bacterium]|nr:MAG: peptidoglycan-binding protein [Rhodospirillales bacterium]